MIKKQTFSYNIKTLFIFSLFGFLTSCGSSGGGDSVDKVQTIQTGQFIDGPVSGLYYETQTQRGITSLNGEFEYIEGEDVIFYLGDLAFPSVRAIPVITPLNYVPSAADASNPSVVNIARVLQSLDMDMDHGNGIQLPSSLSENITARNTEALIFNVDVDEFESLPQVNTLLQNNNISQLVSASVAAENFQQTIDAIKAELIENAANEVALDPAQRCFDRNGIEVDSPFPCVPGSGGRAVGDIVVSSVISTAYVSPGDRDDSLVTRNGYYYNLNYLADLFEDEYDVRDFAAEINVGIINFVTTDNNSESLNGIWKYTELYFDGDFIGALPYVNPDRFYTNGEFTGPLFYSNNDSLQKVRDRCGLPNNTKQIIVSPGTYSYNAAAYSVSGLCLRLFTNTDPDNPFARCPLLSEVETPVFNWAGQVTVEAGQCIVVNAIGSTGAGDGGPTDGGTTEEESLIYNEIFPQSGTYREPNFFTGGFDWSVFDANSRTDYIDATPSDGVNCLTKYLTTVYSYSVGDDGYGVVTETTYDEYSGNGSVSSYSDSIDYFADFFREFYISGDRYALTLEQLPPICPL